MIVWRDAPLHLRAHLTSRYPAAALQLQYLLAVTLSLALVIAACGGESSDGGGPAGNDQASPTPATTTVPPLALIPLTIITKDGRQVSLQVELAITDEERAQGLMNRPSLPENQGMLFIFPAGEPRTGFWMKDTLIPLSIAFIAGDGTIVDIQDMEPLSLDVHKPDESYDYGLEVNQGWFARNGVQTGDRLDLSGVPTPVPR